MLLVAIAISIPIAVAVYLTMLVRLAHKLKTVHQEYWFRIGSPSLSDPNGQFAFMWKVIFANDLPPAISHACKSELITIRMFLVISGVLLVVVPLLVLSGVVAP